MENKKISWFWVCKIAVLGRVLKVDFEGAASIYARDVIRNQPDATLDDLTRFAFLIGLDYDLVFKRR